MYSLTRISDQFPILTKNADNHQFEIDKRLPTWKGLEDVKRIQNIYELDDINLVKPGIGETTRVLLKKGPLEDFDSI